MQSGESESLGTEIDGLLRDSGIGYGRVEQHLLNAASQNGVSAKATEALLRQRLLGIWKDRLDGQARRLSSCGEAAVAERRKALEGLSERNKASVLGRMRRRRSQFDALERRILSAWRAMPRRVVGRLRDATPKVEFRCELDADDLRLVSRWRRSPSTTNDEETKRLESARLGEKAAISYYGGLGQEVEDVSIQDLETEDRRDWVTHDLRADGRPFDVKNSRCIRADRFTEHYWKNAKYWKSPTQPQAEEVPIVGVVSVEEPDASIVLGELHYCELRRFAQQVARYAEGPRIPRDLGRRRGDWFVPGWLLEYSSRHYAPMPDWDDVLHRWLAVSEALDARDPEWVLALALSRTKSLPRRLESTEVARAMVAFFRQFEVSRRTVFWFVLHYLLSHTHDPGAQKDLVTHLFPGRWEGSLGERGFKGNEFPLGLFDPRQYVWNMIHTLSQMIRSNDEFLKGVSEYRLTGPGILQARIEGVEGKAGARREPWTTILAYCGNCGKWPIFLAGNTAEDRGEHSAGDGGCSHCPCGKGRLVCDECGACSGWKCEGATFRTDEEARRAARDFPGWRAVRRKLLPPTDGRGTPSPNRMPGY